MTEETRAQIRRYNSNIEISGKAVIAFGLWTVAKLFITVVFDINNIRSDIIELLPDQADFLLGITYGLLFAISACILFLNGYVGFSAIRYGRGNRKNKKFVKWAVLLAIITTIFVLIDLKTTDFGDFNRVAEFLADSTLCFIMYDMLLSMKKARSVMKREQG